MNGDLVVSLGIAWLLGGVSRFDFGVLGVWFCVLDLVRFTSGVSGLRLNVVL